MFCGACKVTTKAALVVADAGPLIHLDELAALDVLSDYTAVWLPDAVWHEVIHHRPEALQNTCVNLVRQDSPSPSAQVVAITSLYTLHHGEREALTLCVNHSINTLLTDDTAARLAAKSLNIVTHGTLGLLIRAVRRNLRTPSDVLALLAVIPQQTTLHIRPSLLDGVIRRVQSEWSSQYGVNHER